MAKKKKVREKVPYQKSALLAFRNGVSPIRLQRI